jgi:hypothetical protein
MPQTMGDYAAASYLLGAASRDFSMLVGMGAARSGTAEFLDVALRARTDLAQAADFLGYTLKVKE